MGDEKALAAIGRIERALARIEAAAERQPRPDPRKDEEIAGLKRAHDELRGKVAGAISEIDALLGREGQG